MQTPARISRRSYGKRFNLSRTLAFPLNGPSWDLDVMPKSHGSSRADEIDRPRLAASRPFPLSQARRSLNLAKLLFRALIHGLITKAKA
jgi:hypothetical protein